MTTFNYCSSTAESAGDSDIAAAITCPESVWSRGAGARLRHRHHRRLVPAARHRGPDLPPHQELRRSARRSSLPTAVAVSNNVSRHDKGKRISGWAENAARRGRHGAGDEHRRGGGAGRRGRLCQWRGGRCVRLPNPDNAPPKPDRTVGSRMKRFFVTRDGVAGAGVHVTAGIGSGDGVTVGSGVINGQGVTAGSGEGMGTGEHPQGKLRGGGSHREGVIICGDLANQKRGWWNARQPRWRIGRSAGRVTAARAFLPAGRHVCGRGRGDGDDGGHRLRRRLRPHDHGAPPVRRLARRAALAALRLE